MMITLRLFAVLRDRAGVSKLMVSLPENATAGSATEALLQAHPDLTDLLSRVAVAVNQSYATLQTKLYDGDEVAFIPPVSGG